MITSFDYNNNNSSLTMNHIEINDCGDPDDGGDGEGVWSPDIEQAFQEALLLFPPCGRRKHILQEDGNGKMYGRNELIARHIKTKTGKMRTRKQVSSHIQVLARRNAKSLGCSSSSTGMPSPSSGTSLNSDSALCDGPPSIQQTIHHHHHHHHQNQHNHQLHHHQSIQSQLQLQHHQQSHAHQQLNNPRFFDVWKDRPIVTSKIRLVEFSAFIEYQQNQPSIINNYHQAVTMQAAAAAAAANLIQQTSSSGNQTKINNHSIVNKQQASDMSQIQNVMQQIGVSANGSSLPNLASNQLVTNAPGSHAQFNQSSVGVHNNNGMYNNNNYPISESTTAPNHNHNQLQTQQLQSQQQTSQVKRHSYIKIDYSQLHFRQLENNRPVESININQIYDKFPELCGPTGLFHRAQPDSFFLVKFWADISSDFENDLDSDQNAFFGYSSQFEACEPFRDITCSTKICSYGSPLLEKVEKIEGTYNQANGRHSYNIDRSPMCAFMIEFIRKLRQVPTLALMNSVLENFTVLQVITTTIPGKHQPEILLSLAYVFEILPPITRNVGDLYAGHQYNVYKLTKD